MRDVAREELADFLSTPLRLCCIVNADGTLFGKPFCLSCFKKLRPGVVELALEWEITSLEQVIRWYDC